MRIKLNKKYSPDMITIGAIGCKENSLTQEELENNPSNELLNLKSITEDEDFFIYEFPIENSEINQQNYIFFSVMINDSCNFASFYIGPET